MLGVLTFLVILIIISVIDIRSMMKYSLKKEIIPYLVLMLISGSAGFLYLSDPYRKSIEYLILNIFNIKG